MSTTVTQQTKTRLYGIDILKILSCFSVILVHAVVFRVEKVDASLSWMMANGINAAAREAVPVFFMISGALFLPKETPAYADFFKKIAINYGLPLLGGLITYKLMAISQGDPTSALDGVLYNVHQNLGFHLWFMWTFLGIMLITPLLRLMVRQTRAVWLFLALWLAYCIVEPWLRPHGIAFPIDNMLFMWATGYFVAGYALFRLPWRIAPGWLLAGMVVTVALMTALTARDSLAAGQLTLLYYDNPSPLLALYSACVFRLGVQLPTGPRPRLVQTVAGATFTIYIYHILALSLLSRFIGPTTLPMRVFVHTPLAFAACLGLHQCGKRLPCLRLFFRG